MALTFVTGQTNRKFSIAEGFGASAGTILKSLQQHPPLTGTQVLTIKAQIQIKSASDHCKVTVRTFDVASAHCT